MSDNGVDADPLKVVLCWPRHQPEYRTPSFSYGGGEQSLGSGVMRRNVQ